MTTIAEARSSSQEQFNNEQKFLDIMEEYAENRKGPSFTALCDIGCELTARQSLQLIQEDSSNMLAVEDGKRALNEVEGRIAARCSKDANYGHARNIILRERQQMISALTEQGMDEPDATAKINGLFITATAPHRPSSLS